jgi:hypothetical protein
MQIHQNIPSKLNMCERGGKKEGDIISSKGTKGLVSSQGHKASSRVTSPHPKVMSHEVTSSMKSS